MVEGLFHPAVLRGGEGNVPRDEERAGAEQAVMRADCGLEVIDLVGQLAHAKPKGAHLS